jgi:hypothetical protein
MKTAIPRRIPFNALRSGIAAATVSAALLVPAGAGAAAPAKESPLTVAQAAKAVDGKRAGGDRKDRKQDRAEKLEGWEKRYLEVRGEYVAEFGRKAAGRNIVRHGYQEKDGSVRDARRGEVEESTVLMAGSISTPTEVTEEAAPVEETPAAPAESVDTSGAPTSVVECESGGDYGAVNPAGYYGAYQFDQQTWDAYAPEGYQGTNPAQAPPAVQDAAAANVDYDAWPNC